MKAVVKVGTSSITSDGGDLDDAALARLADELAAARAAGHVVVLVCSGAIAAGLPALGIHERPADVGALQAIAAVGQPRLMERVTALLTARGLVAGQVLLTPHDFGQRSQYLHARQTLACLLELGVEGALTRAGARDGDVVRVGAVELEYVEDPGRP